MPRRQGRRSSRRKARSGLSQLGRSPRKRSAPDRTSHPSQRTLTRQQSAGAEQAVAIPDRLANATWTACVAATLLGMTAAIVVSGLTRYIHAGLTANPFLVSFAPSRVMVVGASLLSIAIGVRVPQRLAIWVCMIAWGRLSWGGRGGRLRDVSGVPVNPGAPERKLYWAAFSIISLIAGVTIAMLPAWIRLTSGVYEFLHVHFVWSNAPLVVLNFTISMLAGVIPLALLGLALSCAHHLCCAYGQWDIRATAWAMMGAALGVWVVEIVAGSGARVDPLLIGAALPPLLVAIGAAALGSTQGQAESSSDPSMPSPLPASSDRWPTLLRASIVAVGGGSVCAISVSVRWLTVGSISTGEVLAPLLLAVGLGIALGARTSISTVRTIGAFGMSCAVAGIVVGVSTYALRMQPLAPLWFAVALTACGVATIGYATSYGRTVLLARVARRSTAGARMLSRLLVCSAVTIVIAEPLVTHFVGRPSTLMLLSMSLVSVGGLLVIYEPSYTPRVRRARLGAVFGSVAAMILLGSLSTISRVSSTAPASLELGGEVETADSPALPTGTHEVAVSDR